MKQSFRVRCIVEGNARATVLSTTQPIAFLKGVDPEKGTIIDSKHELCGASFAGKILVFPNSVGSSVGAYVIYRLKRSGKAPKAIINQNADIITASGCAIAGIPLYDMTEDSIKEFKSGTRLVIDGLKSEVRVL
ncbi:MAG TPA: DUF126 domain-containing protein [Nitrososphaerales archaeon]|nr:DUF126 domain-containing protein [Nitrososphaerales archaeon]